MFLSLQATDTIYVPFDGIVRELMYEVDDTAIRDKPLIMVEVEEASEEGRRGGVEGRGREGGGMGRVIYCVLVMC